MELDHLVRGNEEDKSGQLMTLQEVNAVKQLLADDEEPFSHTSIYAAISMQIVLICFLIIANVVDIPLVKTGSMASTAHALYVVGTTIIVSAAATFTVSQITKLWLCKIADSDWRPEIHSRARTILSLSSPRDKKHA